jgi:uncharacterized membrane protein YphA (DoxX/SURF4 family)
MTAMDLGLLVMRLVVGLTFMGHGSQKLFGWFGGTGMKGHADNVSKMGRSLHALWPSTQFPGRTRN